MRIPRFAAAIAACFVLACNADAQAQRMALAIGDYLARAGSEVVMKAFCIDPTREEPTPATTFRYGYGSLDAVQVEYNGRTYPASEAIARGIGEFRGSDMSGVRFQPKVPGDVRIKVNSPYIFADRNDPPSAARAGAVAAVLKAASPSAPARSVQDTVWTKAVLADNPDELRKQQILLRDLGYSVGNPDGVWGPKYEAAVAAASRTAPNEPWDRDPLNALADVAAASARPLSAPAQQIFAEVMEERLADVGFEGGDAIGRFSRYHGLPAADPQTPAFVDRLKADEKAAGDFPFSAIAAEETSDGGAFLVSRGGAETWVFEDGEVTARARGRQALELLDRNSARAARDASDEGSIFVYPSRYPSANTGRLSLQVGQVALTPAPAEFQAFLSGGAGLPGLQAAIDLSRAGGEGKPSLFVYRGALERSLPEIQEAGIGGIEEGRIPVDSAQLAAALRQHLGRSADVYLASDTDLAALHAASQPAVEKASDITMFKGEKIEDWGAFRDLSSAFEEAKIPVAVDELGNIKAGNVLILTGHRDANLAAYLDQLSESGDLDDKLVVLFSCHGPSCEIGQSRILQSRLNGPTGIVYFPDQIDASAVTMVLKELTLLVKDGPVSPTTITELIDQSITRAIGKRPDLRPMIEKLRRMIVQVSEVIGTFPQVAFAG
jgi:hypothetical protein